MIFRKNKLSKKIVISILSVFSVSVSIFSLSLNNNNSLLEHVSSKTQAISDGEETKISSFTIKTKDQIGDDWDKYNATNITNDVIKNILIPNIDAQFYIQKNTQTSDAVTQGYVTFYVYQKITTYTNGVPTSSKEEKLTPFNNWSANDSSDTNLWSTKNQTNLTGFIKAEKYSFSWNSDENIADFLKSNSLTVSNLKSQANISEIIRTNFISSSSFLPDGTTFTIADADTITNASKYGVAKITVTFPANSNASDNWENNTYPGDASTNSVTRIVRGFPAPSSSDSNLVQIESQNLNNIVNATLSSDAINQLNLSDYLLTTTNVSLKNLLPSQIASISQPGLRQLFLNENNSNYLTFTDNKPAIRMTYMGKNISDTNFASDTGLNKTYQDGNLQDVTKYMMISNISVNPNDLEGSLILSYTYSTFDVISNKILPNQIGSMSFPANSFRNNPEAGQNLFFSFKTSDELTGFTSTSSIMNNFNANKDNSEYLKALSNSFINGSNYAYSRDRTLSISNGANNSISVTITFDDFNGNVYTDTSGTKHYGLSLTQNYTLSGQSLNVNWKSQNNVQSSISNYANLTPSEICNMISEGIISENVFLENSSNFSILFIPDSVNGTLTVQASNGNGTETQFFTGFKKMSSADADTVLEFSWISNNDISTSLLSIPVQNITVNDVIKYYLSEIPYFSSLNLNQSNVKIKSNSDGTLQVDVTLTNWNQSVPGMSSSSQTFSTTLKGFVTYDLQNKNSYVSPEDLTVLLSAIFASVISLSLIGILVCTILKRKKISKLSKKKFDK